MYFLADGCAHFQLTSMCLESLSSKYFENKLIDIKKLLASVKQN